MPPTAPRIACLRVPDLPLAAELRAHPELGGTPLAIAAGPGPRAEIVAVSPEATQQGVRPGTAVVHARAAVAGLAVRVASPARAAAARDALLDVALSASPRAALAPPGEGAWGGEAAVFVDARGVDRLFRSEAGFATVLVERARAVGLPAASAVASSRTVARTAARALAPDAVRVVEAGSEAAFLAPLPLDLLQLSDALAEICTRFGLRRVGDLARLPRRGLSRRLGPEGLRLAALARGEEPREALPTPTATRAIEATDLEYAVDRLEPLTFVLRGLLSRLAARLDVRGLACGALELDLSLEGGGRDARRVGVAAPTADVRVLLRLACLALEARPPPAPVEAVSIATEPEPQRRDQLDLFRPAGPAPAVLSRTLAELEALCGDGRVGAPAVADSHHPDAVALRPFAPTADATAAPPAARLALRALRPPLPAQVRLQAGRPVWLRSAVAGGPVVSAAGPWRSTGQWWSPEAHFAFDHFDVQTSEGALVRLRYDAVERRWSVDAVYD